MRQLGWHGLPVVGKLAAGWHLSLKNVLCPNRGDLYAERRKLARVADTFREPPLDAFGGGWNGEQISWCPLYPQRPYRCFRERFVEDKIRLLSEYRFTLAFENYRGRHGYITDKLFDGFLAGSVPVYLGDEGIGEIVPASAFVERAPVPGLQCLAAPFAVLS